MRIAVIGAGGTGGYYGAQLQRSGQEVAFIARGGHLAAMRERGLRVESAVAEPLMLNVRATHRPEEIGTVDLVLFTVKSYHTQEAARLLAPLIGGDTAVVTLQNGVDNVEVLIEAAGRGHVLGGLCRIFSTIAAPGVIRQTGGPRSVVFGELEGAFTPRATSILEAFQTAEIPTELSRHILVDMWEKYLFITAQGGMTALTRLPIGAILATPETREVYLDAASEVAAVGRAHGVAIPADERERVLKFAQALDPGLYSSLYHDLIHGNRMEVEALPGNVVRLGKRYGLPTPVCRAIYATLLPHDLAAQQKRN
ncbi:MAG: 2-dehydropantoate 2-reductase [Armatimonadetes bacterium]|nr:2-dehydropantoate 2-reductase [Armatimonadota bacterium]